MANIKFIEALQQWADFTNDEASLVSKRFIPRKIEKKTIILSHGEVSKEAYFVVKGCLRLYYEKNGNDISAYFFTENMFAGSYDSFLSGKPTRHTLVALEDCEILTLSYQDLQELYQELPKMNEFVRKVIEDRFISIHNLYASLILDSPEERYSNLLEERPDLIQRIPQRYLATFLGVTPVSLSRIRKRVAKKQ